MAHFLYDESFFILSTPKSIEYIFQYFIRCDSTANKFGKKKEAFTYKLIRQILEKMHGMFILHWVEVNILLEIFQQRKKSFPSALGMKFINKFINPYIHI